jgi:hypothetical protein
VSFCPRRTYAPPLLADEQQNGLTCSEAGISLTEASLTYVLPSHLRVASYWFSSSLGPLKTTLKAELGITNAQYGVVSGPLCPSAHHLADLASLQLASANKLVNTVMPLVSGIAMDYFGAEYTSLAASCEPLNFPRLAESSSRLLRSCDPTRRASQRYRRLIYLVRSARGGRGRCRLRNQSVALLSGATSPTDVAATSSSRHPDRSAQDLLPLLPRDSSRPGLRDRKRRKSYRCW